MPVSSSNRTDVLGIYSALLKDLVEAKPFFESKEFPAKEFAYSSSKLWFQ